MAQVRRLVSAAELEPLYNGIDVFCEKYLSPREDHAEDTEAPKIIADPIEGYCSIERWEVPLLDTLLLQRLRGIHQLGLANLVYPALGYSRFEHTIGVLARLQQVVTSIRENMAVRRLAATDLPPLPTQEQLHATRLAVILHDVGHCLLSHVSEDVIEDLDGTTRYPAPSVVIDCFEKTLGRRLPMAEIFAACIATSPVTVSFLRDAGVPGAGRPREAEAIARSAASLILGLPIPDDPNSLFLAQLMSSGFDVDKLDYMLRESHHSGITLGISLDWLLKKLFLKRVPAAQVPQGLASRLRTFASSSEFTLLALERGGQFAFEEFCVARLALHEKIYLHQKVRAAEAQVKSALRRMAREAPELQEAHRWLYLKECMFEYPEAPLPGLEDAAQLDLLRQNERRTAASLGLDRIPARKLLSRAYAFGWQNSTGDPMLEAPPEDTMAVDNLMELVRRDPDSFLSEVRRNLQTIRELLDADEGFPDDATEILVDPPRLTTLQQGHDSVYIEYPNRLSLRWMMPIDQIESYYHRHRALAYVFSERHALPYVLLAAERAAWDLCGVICVQDGVASNHVLRAAKDLRLALHQREYYSDARPLQPISEYLSGVEAQRLVSSAARSLAIYEPRSRLRVTPSSTTTFISQFPQELQEAALVWIQHIEVVRPELEIRKAFQAIVRTTLFAGCSTVGLSPLGALSDSAGRMAYDIRDIEQLADGQRVFDVPLAEALSMSLDGYILYDDNTNSGLQALNIMAAWLGLPLPEEMHLHEEHVQEMPAGMRDKLTSMPVALIFSVATEGATTRLVSSMSEYLKLKAENIAVESGKVLLASNRIFSGSTSPFQHADKLALKEFVQRVGAQLFRNEGKSCQEAEGRSLGDNHAEAMVVFPYNCPTMTVPALWNKGRAEQGDWMPLVERGRRYDPSGEHLVGEEA